MIIYVDDIKMAGPKNVLPEAWKLLREPPAPAPVSSSEREAREAHEARHGLKIGFVEPTAHFSGCTHEKGQFKLANGTVVNSMTYNMESFLRSTVDLYLSLSRQRGFCANLRDVATPFIAEDHSASPQGAPCGSGQAVYCPACRHAFPL